MFTPQFFIILRNITTVVKELKLCTLNYGSRNGEHGVLDLDRLTKMWSIGNISTQARTDDAIARTESRLFMY